MKHLGIITLMLLFISCDKEDTPPPDDNNIITTSETKFECKINGELYVSDTVFANFLERTNRNNVSITSIRRLKNDTTGVLELEQIFAIAIQQPVYNGIGSYDFQVDSSEFYVNTDTAGIFAPFYEGRISYNFVDEWINTIPVRQDEYTNILCDTPTGTNGRKGNITFIKDETSGSFSGTFYATLCRDGIIFEITEGVFSNVKIL